MPATAAPVPSLAAWRDRHAGETIVVCGCGRSLRDLPEPRRWTTIGVNDVGRLFDPSYLVVLNPRSQFSGDRFRHVAESRARALFTQLDDRQLAVDHGNIVRFRLGRRGGTDLTTLDALPYTRNSPYVAVCLAAYMGAKRIGLVGVDFTEHHFFADTGTHALTRELALIDREYAALAAALAARGIEFVNLSPTSRLTALPKIDAASFLGGTRAVTGVAPARCLNIVSYATTPVAGVPAILARCISARTPHRARCVWSDRGYGNGVTFDGDIEWKSSAAQAEAALAAADVVIVHNGKVDPAHRRVLAQKPVVTMAHNYMWNVDAQFVQRGLPGLVIGQYQATLPEFAGWSIVPNPVPLWEPAFSPGDKPATLTIAYTPSGRHERYPQGHRLYWHAKGFDTTMSVLERLAARHGIRLEVLRQGQLSHAESLAMKRRAHVVIDECVTGSYHRNSLEGLAAGCVVVNGVGLLPGIADAFRRCAPDADRVPFASCALDDLERALTALIADGVERGTASGAANRAWMERHWEFTAQWDEFWWPAIAAALDRGVRAASVIPASSPRRAEPMRPARHPVALAEKVSVVVPHGGADRLRHLTTTLVTLKQRDVVGEVIVAEMGTAPVAAAIAGRWADKYVFMPNAGVFERARALNVGSGLADCPLILWNDNDIVTGGDFIARAARELRERRLDYLIPYSSIRYLSAPDSTRVMEGSVDPADCRAQTVFYSGRRVPACSGGAGLVTRDFLLRAGGLIESFKGWGGEDNAWTHKVQLLGRIAPTGRPDQHAYHLFHPSSAGYQGNAASAHNPHYAANLQMLRWIRSFRDPRQFQRHFPPPRHRPCAWDPGRRILVLAADDERTRAKAQPVAPAFRSVYGAAVEEAIISDGNGWHERAAAAEALVIVGAASFVRMAADASPDLLRKAVMLIDEDEADPRQPDAAPPVLTMRVAAATGSGEATASRLAGPLSLILAGAAESAAPAAAVAEALNDERSPVRDSLPVWTYWEGPRPAWIDRCRSTIAAHGADVRLLTPEMFDQLRDRDRDVNIAALGPAQRADFIRAFLLARYGGLWIDADCIVMQPLSEVLALLDEHDFIAHRERSGLVSNGFIGARAGSRIAALFYQRVCQILRSRQPIGWNTLGSQALMDVLRAAATPWHEIPCQRIQPICWSEPAAFFARAADQEHERRVDPLAICYMLSNTEIRKHLAAGASNALADPDTFFTFLVNKSMAHASSTAETVRAAGADVTPSAVEQTFGSFVAAYRRYGDESLSGPGSSLAQTAVLRERLPLLLQDLGIRSLLDAPCGDFNWMRCVNVPLDRYVGADILREIVAQNVRRYETPRRRFVHADLRRDPLPSADAILCRDCLVHLSYEDSRDVLRNFKRSGARYLLTTSFPAVTENRDTSDCEWRPLNLQLAPFGFPPPLRAVNEACSEAGGAYRDKSLMVWRLDDLPLG